MKVYERTSTIDNLIERTIASLKTISTNETIFGNPTNLPDGTSIIPVSKITVGFVVGGGEYADVSTRRVATHYPTAGGSGGAVMLNPIGFLVSTPSEVKFVSTTNETNYQKILDLVAKTAEKISSSFEKKEKNK